MRFIVIGITDNPKPWFPPEVMETIRQGRVFSGGRRHHEIVASLLPTDAQWIDITVPLDKVFEQYRKPSPSRGERGEGLCIFASGDPLFFGFANTLRREFPDAEMQVYPAPNSLQMLAHRLLMPYHDMRIVSLTGRPWPEFDRALIERAPKIGVLTDREHTPSAIARRMLEYGYSQYKMYVGEHLGNPSKEQVTSLSLEEATQQDFSHPNCLILDTNYHELNTNYPQININDNSCSIHGNSCLKKGTFGIPDQAFTLLDGRTKMITKMPIRLLTLQALDLPKRRVLWDIGACTGSVSIEARLLFPHLQIEAFEIRPECEAIIHENMRRHGALGIGVHIGDFCSFCCESAATNRTPGTGDKATTGAQPDAVFIGGHGGKLKEIMAKVLRYLAPDGVIVMNSVKAPLVQTDSHRLWDEACRDLGLKQAPPTRIILNDNHPIEILKCSR